jgi:hypothetical protein
MAVMSRRRMMFAAGILGAAVLTAVALIASVTETGRPHSAIHHQGWTLSLGHI